MTGEDRRPGGNAAARLGAITGNCRTTVVGSAAIKDTFDDLSVVGTFVAAKRSSKKQLELY